MNCPICKQKISNGVQICHTCGYSLKDYMIVNKESLRALLRKLRHENSWIEEVSIKLRISKTRDFETYSSIADVLGESKSNTSRDINLAIALNDFPELKQCKNKSQANLRLNEKGTKFSSEKELQKYLFRDWEKTPFSKEWELVRENIDKDGRYKIKNFGEIDLLAKHRKENKWLVIELKRGKAIDDALGQTLRYMGWVKIHCAHDEGTVEGIIISSTLDQHTEYALFCLPNVDLWTYRYDNDKWEFISLEEQIIEKVENLCNKETADKVKQLLKAKRAEKKQ